MPFGKDYYRQAKKISDGNHLTLFCVKILWVYYASYFT